jgi:hypothetical protein
MHVLSKKKLHNSRHLATDPCLIKILLNVRLSLSYVLGLVISKTIQYSIEYDRPKAAWFYSMLLCGFNIV